MFTGVREKHLIRIVCRFEPEGPWQTYWFLRVTYGDKIAVCAIEVAKSILFEYGKIIHEDTAFKIGQSDYDEDSNVGAA